MSYVQPGVPVSPAILVDGEVIMPEAQAHVGQHRDRATSPGAAIRRPASSMAAWRQDAWDGELAESSEFESGGGADARTTTEPIHPVADALRKISAGRGAWRAVGQAGVGGSQSRRGAG